MACLLVYIRILKFKNIPNIRVEIDLVRTTISGILEPNYRKYNL